jgi:hypothetical protein
MITPHGRKLETVRRKQHKYFVLDVVITTWELSNDEPNLTV